MAKTPVLSTASKLAEMFVENTGRHMLDSGDHYGRAWQSNQNAVAAADVEPVEYFESRPKVVLDTRSDYVDVQVDAFHWLLDRVAFDGHARALNERFQKRYAKDEDSSWLENIEEFIEETADRDGFCDGGYNTYNGECSLSQTLQFSIFHIDDVAYVALQVHGGCDVRGGYTAPVIFSVLGEESDLLDWDVYTVVCESKPTEKPSEQIPGVDWAETEFPVLPHVWDVQNGYWISTDGSGDGRDPWEGVDPIKTDEETGNRYLACPKCGSPMTVYPHEVG